MTKIPGKVTKTPALVLNQTIAGMIGARIREERIAQGLTLAELCNQAGLVAAHPKNRMYEIETAKRKEGVRLGTLYAIAAALNIEVTELMPDMNTVIRAAPVSRRVVVDE